MHGAEDAHFVGLSLLLVECWVEWIRDTKHFTQTIAFPVSGLTSYCAWIVLGDDHVWVA